ncbi:hypothetical protein RF11_15429 [Thelohanellus kitauei]|uniref:Integrase catalytic domain-containing protein n=1 Tax=Thelohanellus kitauei TaxID=669202 RepID=A0A0C2J5I4_THEKT|nr:hypothetical protein RF11_15429 [Thelohanellus kitauei]
MIKSLQKCWRPKPNIFALRNEVVTKIKHLVRDRVLESVDRTITQILWASPIVIARKATGRIRTSRDFRVTRPLQEVAISSIERWVLKLSSFDFDIMYKPGRSNGLAYALSRLPWEEKRKMIMKDGDIATHKFIDFVHRGWPGKPDLDRPYRPFYEITDHLSNEERILMFEHQTPTYSWNVPEGPVKRLNIDFTGPFVGYYWFVLVDAFSKCMEIFHTDAVTPTTFVSCCIQILHVLEFHVQLSQRKILVLKVRTSNSFALKVKSKVCVLLRITVEVIGRSKE